MQGLSYISIYSTPCLLTIDASFSYQMSVKFGIHHNLSVVHSVDL